MDRMTERQQAIRLTVAKDGSGDYDMVGAALEALGDKEDLGLHFYKRGVYRGNGWKLKARNHIGGPVSRRQCHCQWTVCWNDHGGRQ